MVAMIENYTFSEAARINMHERGIKTSSKFFLFHSILNDSNDQPEHFIPMISFAPNRPQVGRVEARRRSTLIKY